MPLFNSRVQVPFNLAVHLTTVQRFQLKRLKRAMQPTLLIAMAFCVMTGCQSNALTGAELLHPQQYLASPVDQEIYASLLTQQCQGVSRQQDQARIQQLSAYLQHHGIAVKAYSLGLDGKMRVQQCGTADGRGVIFRIATQDMQLAKTLGFVPVSKDTLRLPRVRD